MQKLGFGVRENRKKGKKGPKKAKKAKKGGPLSIRWNGLDYLGIPIRLRVGPPKNRQVLGSFLGFLRVFGRFWPKMAKNGLFWPFLGFSRFSARY